jgi:hypothetical protein
VARLLAANLVPVVWVPPIHVRQLRQLLSQRRQMVETHTQILNRMHSVAHRHHLNHPAGKRFNEKNTGWQKDKILSRVEQLQLAIEMENREYIEKQIEKISKEVGKMSHQKPWAESMTYIMQLPGWRRSVTSGASRPRRNWEVIPGWRQELSKAARRTVGKELRKKGVGNCAGPWWKQRNKP